MSHPLSASQRTASEYGRVGVLFGGDSAEREVSLQSGDAVMASLLRSGVDVIPVDGLAALCDALQAGRLDRVFNVMHGRGGEDGIAQGVMEAFSIPYTGSNVMSSALAMDKYRSKLIWQSLDLPTASCWLIDYASSSVPDDAVLKAIEAALPVVVKPNREGSTVGLSVVRHRDELATAITKAAQHDRLILVEQYIEGADYTVAILDEQALPSIRILPFDGLYDYAAKYVNDTTRYECPALEGGQEQALLDLSLRASQALGVSGWSRVDVMRDNNGKNWLLEVNTVPGMTAGHSLVPMAAAAEGIDFDALNMAILETSW